MRSYSANILAERSEASVLDTALKKRCFSVSRSVRLSIRPARNVVRGLAFQQVVPLLRNLERVHNAETSVEFVNEDPAAIKTEKNLF